MMKRPKEFQEHERIKTLNMTFQQDRISVVLNPEFITLPVIFPNYISRGGPVS